MKTTPWRTVLVSLPVAVAVAVTLAAPSQLDAQISAEQEREWNQPVEPFRIVGNLYYVGAREVASYLVATPAGHVVIDSGFEETVPQILANIETLGFSPRDVKLLLASHAHSDHVGGMASLRERTGAELRMSAADAELAKRGGLGDPNFGDTFRYPAFTPDRGVADREVIALGGTSLTAHLTPGHTPGCTTWTLTVEERGQPLQVVLLCSLTTPGYRLVGNPAYPTIAEDLRASLDRVATLPADVFLAPHGSFFDLLGKRAALGRNPERNPFIVPGELAAHVGRRREAFEKDLAKELEKNAPAVPAPRGGKGR